MEEIDLFEHWEDMPIELAAIVDNYSYCDYDYTALENFLSEVESIGYTFDYGLDAVPYGLKEIKC